VTDWTKTSGTNGTMMIRDTGSSVEFWFKAGNSAEWVNGLAFNWTANGSTNSNTINYPTGADWYHVGSVSVSTNQTVTFRLLTDTSIPGIGGPTTFSHAITRATEPPSPDTPQLSSIKSTSILVKFASNGDGGADIDLREIGYSTNSGVISNTTISDGSTTVGGLNPGTRYYFWARVHNFVGWSNWSGRTSAVTLRVPDAPTKPLLASITSTTVEASFSQNGNGGAIVTSSQVGYGTNSSAPTTIDTAGSPHIIDGLTPGTMYYVWARVQNSVGWSPWSASASFRTVAGAYIKVGTEWKIAVPYVRVSGVWKKAEPWVCNQGVWNRTV